MSSQAEAPQDSRMQVSFLLNTPGQREQLQQPQQAQHNTHNTNSEEAGTIQKIRHLQAILQQNSLAQLAQWEKERHMEMYIKAKATMNKVVDSLSNLQQVTATISSENKTNTKNLSKPTPSSTRRRSTNPTRKEKIVFHHYIQPTQHNTHNVKTISFEDTGVPITNSQRIERYERAIEGESERPKVTYTRKKRLGGMERDFLEGVYLDNPFPTKGQVKDLASELKLSPVQIRNWFNYRRNSERRILRQSIES